MRKEIYLAVIDRLKTIQEADGSATIKHFDLWNQNIDFIEQEAPWQRPAVFIEFLPIRWANMAAGIQTADVAFSLHVVTDWTGGAEDGSLYQEDALSMFNLLDRINKALSGYSKQYPDGGAFRAIQRTGSNTNHNHEEILESIETYNVNVTDLSGKRF